MKPMMKFAYTGLALVVALGLLAGCGADTEKTKDRGGMPFMRSKLKNNGPEGGPPATAEVVATNKGRSSQTHSVGPVLPGAEVETQTGSEQGADSVSVTVNAGGTFTGSGTYTGSSIESVDIEIGAQGGTATVNFHLGLPSEQIQLTQ